MIQVWKRGFSTRGIVRFHGTSISSNGNTAGGINVDKEGLPVPKSSAYANKEETQKVFIKLPRSFIPVPLPLNLRAGYFPLYTAPAVSYISLVKRITLGSSLVGLYVAYLIHNSPNFSDELAALTAALSVVPVPFAHYFTRHYVTKIFRLYDKNKVPQTLDNLTQDETLIMEKLTAGGKRHYNELVKVNKLKLTKSLYGTKLWQHTDENGVIRYYYVADDLGGIKMDRIWGIVEKNSGINNGRLT